MRRIFLGAALTVAGLLVTLAFSPALFARSNAPQIVSPGGVGALRLGARVSALHRRHLIGRLRPGCELDPGQRIAPLRAPLSGFAIFSHPNTRLAALSITNGAETASQIGIGSTPAEAREAYPRALYEPPGSVEPFAEGFFWVNGISHPKLTFTVDATTHLISVIGVPAPAFCE